MSAFGMLSYNRESLLHDVWGGERKKKRVSVIAAETRFLCVIQNIKSSLVVAC